MPSAPTPPLIQIAYVVDDIDKAIDFWTGVMKVGPFFKFPPLVAESGDLRGRPYLPNYAAATAYSGDLNIELIRPLGGPSIFQEYLDSGRNSVQHLCRFVDDLAVAEKEVLARGARRLQGNVYPDGTALAYYDMGGDQGVVLELAALKPQARGLFAAIKEAGANWDGVTRLLTL